LHISPKNDMFRKNYQRENPVKIIFQKTAFLTHLSCLANRQSVVSLLVRLHKELEHFLSIQESVDLSPRPQRLHSKKLYMLDLLFEIKVPPQINSFAPQKQFELIRALHEKAFLRQFSKQP